MSLNYTTLQSTVLAQAVHTELTTEVVQFIRMCESMIRREVTALELRSTLDETDRSSGGVYNLSGQVQEIRQIYATASDGSTYALENVGLAGIRMLPADSDVQHYAVSGQTVEFRGVPGTDAELEIVYFGWPDPLSVTDSNELLTNFEDLYVFGTLFYLYNFTQDLELAQSALSVFTDAVEKINRATSRRIGGGSVLPAYNFGHVRTSTGY
jgi:hypothetical protein